MRASGTIVNRAGTWRDIAALFCVATVLCLVPASVDAQEAEDLSSGVRIRTNGRDNPHMWIVGNYMGADGDSIRVQLESGSQLSIARESIWNVEVSRGQRSMAGTGAVIGGVAGLLIGAVAGIGATADDAALEEVFGVETGDHSGEILLVAAGGAVVGALAGALIGSRVRRERWEPVPQSRLTIYAPCDGIGLHLAVRF